MYGKRLGSPWRRRVIGSAIALILALSILVSAPGVASAHGWGRVKQIDKFVEKMGNNVKKQSDLRFGDLADAFWAASTIAKMRGLGVINGYDGNEFRPNSSVSQAEALTMMVRAFDLEDEAEDMVDRFGLSYDQLLSGRKDDHDDHDEYDHDEDDDDDDDELGTVMLNGTLLPGVGKNDRWALGYILLAVDEGWVQLSECNPHKAASRAWISKVMVRALDHEAQALAKMNATLPFTDAAAIPADSIGFVAEAVAMGLFQGYEDGTFQPNKPVTRAEMATILERFLGDELPEVPFLVSGTVQSISGSSLTLKTAAGTTFTYTVSADALIIVNRKPATLSAVKAGDLVEVLSNGNGTALLLTVKSRDTVPPTSRQIQGEIVAIATPPAVTLKIAGQANRTVTLAQACSIKYGSVNLTYEQLLMGDVVNVTLVDDKATAITVVSRANTSTKISGVIQGITTSSAGVDIILKQSTSTSSVTVRLAGTVVVTYGTATLTVTDLRINDQVEATVVNGTATAVKILSRDFAGDYDGTITSVTHTSTDTTIVVTKQGISTSIKVTPQTAITYGPTTLSRGDLRVGDVVVVNVQDNKATTVSVQTRTGAEKVTGVIQGISSSSAGIDVVVKQGTTTRTLRLAQSVQVTYGTAILTAADLRANDEIEATLQDGVVTQVKILTRDVTGDYDGTISSVTHTSTDTTIVVTKQSISTTIKVTPQTTITFGTEALARGELKVGDVVVATVQSGIASAISIQSRIGVEKVTGMIETITSATEGVDVVLRIGTATRTVRLASSLQIAYGDSTLAVSDLRVDDQVEVTIVSSAVSQVKLLARDMFGDLGGTITSVTQTAADTVIVVTADGNSTTVKVTPETVIKWGAAITLTRGDLRVGDVLRIKLVATASTPTAQEIRITTRGAGL